MGSGGADYSNQINESLRQANTPKSALANSVSGFVQGSFPNAFAGLLNGGSLGNSFPGYQGGANSPGMVFNRNPLGYAGSIGTQDPNAPPPVPGGGNPNYPSGVYDNPSSTNMFGLQSSNQGIIDPVTGAPIGSQASVQSLRNAGGVFADTGMPGQYAAQTGGGIPDFLKGMRQTNGQPGTQAQIAGMMSDPSIVSSMSPEQFAAAMGFGQQSPTGGSTFPGGTASYNMFGGGSRLPVFPGGPSDTNPSTQPVGNPVAVHNPLVQPPNQGRDTNPGSAPQQNFPTFPYDPTGQLYQNPTTQYPPGNGGLGSILPVQSANPQFAALNMGGQNQQALATLMQQFQAPGNNLIPQGGGQLLLNQPTGMDTDYYNALTQNLNNQLNVGSKNLQAQFGATGGSSRGTPAAYAQAQYQAMALPQLAAALGQARQGEAANQLAGQANQNNALLGASNINANAALGTNQLNSQNAGNVLNNQLGFQTNQNQANLGQNSLQSLLAQFNSGQQNSIAQQYAQMQQSANESQIGRQFTGLQNFSQIAAALAGAGIPGGSANVNLGGQSQSDMSQLSQLISALGSLG